MQLTRFIPPPHLARKSQNSNITHQLPGSSGLWKEPGQSNCVSLSRVQPLPQLLDIKISILTNRFMDEYLSENSIKQYSWQQSYWKSFKYSTDWALAVKRLSIHLQLKHLVLYCMDYDALFTSKLLVKNINYIHKHTCTIIYLFIISYYSHYNIKMLKVSFFKFRI